MALEKEIKEENGIVVNYHRIDSLIINYACNVCNVVVSSYFNKDYRDLEKEPQNSNTNYNISSKTFNIDMNEDMRKELYDLLKRNDFFSNAEDC